MRPCTIYGLSAGEFDFKSYVAVTAFEPDAARGADRERAYRQGANGDPALRPSRPTRLSAKLPQRGDEAGAGFAARELSWFPLGCKVRIYDAHTGEEAISRVSSTRVQDARSVLDARPGHEIRPRRASKGLITHDASVRASSRNQDPSSTRVED